MGPGAGFNGGQVVAEGSPQSLQQADTLTASYLNGMKEVAVPAVRRAGSGKVIKLEKATGNNLKAVTVEFPLGVFIAVTGVSGSGKSTLITETLYPILNHHFFRAKKQPMPYKKIAGLEHIDKVIEIDQSPIGR